MAARTQTSAGNGGDRAGVDGSLQRGNHIGGRQPRTHDEHAIFEPDAGQGAR